MKEERGQNHYGKLSGSGATVAEKLGIHPNSGSGCEGDSASDSISYHVAVETPHSATQKFSQAQKPVLAAIERALDKIEAGGFGYCDNCGARLPLERLVVNPTLEICNRCEKNKR